MADFSIRPQIPISGTYNFGAIARQKEYGIVTDSNPMRPGQIVRTVIGLGRVVDVNRYSKQARVWLEYYGKTVLVYAGAVPHRTDAQLDSDSKAGIGASPQNGSRGGDPEMLAINTWGIPVY